MGLYFPNLGDIWGLYILNLGEILGLNFINLGEVSNRYNVCFKPLFCRENRYSLVYDKFSYTKI